MENIIVILILAAVIGLAAWYVIRAKKQGRKCIGCPSKDCFTQKGGCSGNCQCCEKQEM